MKNPGLRVFGAVMAPERPPTHPIWGDINEDVDPDRRLDPDEEDSDFMPSVNFGRWRNPGQSVRVPFRVNPPYQPGESPHDVIYGELLTKEDQDSADGILRGDHESDHPSGDPYVELAREDLRTSASRDAVDTLSGLLSGGSPQDVGGLDEAHDYLSRHFTGVRVNPHHGTLLAQGPSGTQFAIRGAAEAPGITEAPEEPAKPPVFSLTNRHGTFDSSDPRRIVRTMVAFQIVHNALEAKRKKKREEAGLATSSGFMHELIGGGLGKRIIRNLVHGVPTFTVPEDAVFEPGHGTDQNEKGQRGGWVSAHGLPGWHHDPESGAYYSPNHSMSEHLDPAKAMKPWPDPYHAGHTYTYMANPDTGHTIERRKNGITYFVTSLHPSARGSGFDLPPQPPPPQQPKKTPMPNRYRASSQSNDLCPVCASGYLEPYDREFHECLNCGSLVKHVGFERHAGIDDYRQFPSDTPVLHGLGAEPPRHVTQGQHDLLGELGWVIDRESGEYLKSSNGKVHVLSPQGRGEWLHSVTNGGPGDAEFGAVHPDLGSAMNAVLDINSGVKPRGEYRRVRRVASRSPRGLGRGLGDIGPYEGDPLNLASGGSENPENDLPEGEYAHPLAGEEPDPEYVGYEAPRNILDKRAEVERDRILDLGATGVRCASCGADVDETCRTPSGKPTDPHSVRINRYVNKHQKNKSRLASSTFDDADLVDEHLGKLGFQPIHKPNQSRTYVMQDPSIGGSYFRLTEGAPNAQGEPSGWALTAEHIPQRERWTQNGEEFQGRSIPVQRRTVQPGKPQIFKQPLPDPGERAMGKTTFLASGTHPIDDDSLNRAIRDVAINGRGSETYRRAITDTAYEPPRIPRPGPGKTQRELRGLSSVSNPGLMRFVG